MLDSGRALVSKVLKFRDERDWRQFHSPKNLAEAISVESGELLERFLWLKTGVPEELGEARLAAVSEEVADVMIFVIYLCDVLHIDMASAIEQKIAINAAKYPVAKAKGVAKKYKEL